MERPTATRGIPITLALLWCACAGSSEGTSHSDSGGSQAPNADVAQGVRLQVSKQADNCPGDGHTIEAGIDENGNGRLDDDEVDEVVQVCDGAEGPGGAPGRSSLLSLSDEPEGDHCAAGGIKVEAGLDDGTGQGTPDDGVLHPDEVHSTEYVCHGGEPPSGDAGAPPPARPALACSSRSCGDGTEWSTGPQECSASPLCNGSYCQWTSAQLATQSAAEALCPVETECSGEVANAAAKCWRTVRSNPLHLGATEEEIAPLVSECLAESHPTLPAACGDCHVAAQGCVGEHCLRECLAEESMECHTCREVHCAADFYTSTGLADPALVNPDGTAR